MPEVNHAPAWLEFLKKPENLMTGLVLAAGLAQPRREGQSRLGQIGERAVGAMAFRGGLEHEVLDRERQTTLDQQAAGFRERQLGQGDRQLSLQQSEGAANRATQAAEGEATRRTQKELATTVRPETPEEAALKKAQAGYYNRLPVAAGGTEKKGPFDDPYEEEMFKQFVGSKMATDPNYVVNPMEWLAHVQPYRNANAMLKGMREQGIMGEVVMTPATAEHPQGQFVVRVKGVGPNVEMPTAAPSGETVATIEPPSSIGQAIETGARETKERAEAKAKKKYETGGALPEEMAPYRAQLEQLGEDQLSKLLKNPKLKVEEARVIRSEIARRKNERTRNMVMMPSSGI